MSTDREVYPAIDKLWNDGKINMWQRLALQRIYDLMDPESMRQETAADTTKCVTLDLIKEMLDNDKELKEGGQDKDV
jgi:uncharacterized protein YcaQ